MFRIGFNRNTEYFFENIKKIFGLSVYLYIGSTSDVLQKSHSIKTFDVSISLLATKIVQNLKGQNVNDKDDDLDATTEDVELIHSNERIKKRKTKL